MTLHALGGVEPHPSWGGWAAFLVTCELRAVADGVLYYGKTNCNYLIFPDGLIVRNYGYAGEALMNAVRSEGWRAVHTRVQSQYAALKEA